MVDSIRLNSAISGINKGFENLDSITSKISGKTSLEDDNPQSLASSLVSLKTSALQIAASAQVMKSVDETLETLLDVKA